MKKASIVVVVAVFCFLISWLLFGGSQCKGVSCGSRFQSTEFQDRLTEEAVKRIGQPIEGFDAPLLQQAFPVFVDQDFAGVETLGGVYEFEDGNLVYKRRQLESVTSAEQAISSGGYEKLLHNIAKRFDVEVQDRDSLNALLKGIFDGVVPPRILDGDVKKIIYGTDAAGGTEEFEADCKNRGGVFNTCGSACQPGAEMCVAVCAFTCEFPEE